MEGWCEKVSHNNDDGLPTEWDANIYDKLPEVKATEYVEENGNDKSVHHWWRDWILVVGFLRQIEQYNDWNSYEKYNTNANSCDDMYYKENKNPNI